MADPVSEPKKQRLDSANPPPYAFALPPHPPNTSTHPVHSTSPPRTLAAPSHAIPPPPVRATAAAHPSFPGAQNQSSSLPPLDTRALPHPRTIPSPGQRPHGVAGPPPVNSVSSYRPPPTPQSASAQDPQSSRSLSISLESKSQSTSQGMEHGGHQSPWSATPEQRPNGTIPTPNGYGHTISPPHPTEQAFNPPSVGGPVYGQPIPSPYGQQPYMGGHYPGSSQPLKRKHVRATQACNNCRMRKQKCDEARPCQFCRENNFECQYKDVPPPKTDRSMMMLQESVNDVREMLKDFMRGTHMWQQSVESRLSSVQSVDLTSNHASPETNFVVPQRDHSASRRPTPVQVRGQLHRTNSMKTESPVASYTNMSPGAANVSTPVKHETFGQPSTPAGSTKQTARSNAGKEWSGLQSDHTTPAHKLLEQWQSMHDFWKNVDYLKKLVENGHAVSDYPMRLEQDRGLLRVWGVGEGHDLCGEAQGPGSPESSNVGSSNSSDIASPAPNYNGIWGQIPMDRPPPNSSAPRDYGGYEGGLGPDGKPNFDSKVLFELLESYMNNIHNLHPFITASKLRRMVRDFCEQYSPDLKAGNVLSPVNGLPNSHFNHGIKRKRSSGNFGETSPPIDRLLRNAIVLLVFALGKVTSCLTPLPAVPSDRSSFASGSHGYVHSPHFNGSFNSDASEDSRPKNLDILPGLAYYAYATDILGNQQGGNTIGHAQANILAALYQSQFARVLESWSWINIACRITMVLIKDNLPKLHRDFYSNRDVPLSPKERYRLNLIMCVYWTCLQLESDILAEMSTLPPSNISAYQGDIMYPQDVRLMPDDEATPMDMAHTRASSMDSSDVAMKLYSSQIYLRITLNVAHNALYGASGHRSFDSSNYKDVAEHAKSYIHILKEWRKMQSEPLAWQDDEPPSTDLNTARLRAKYYGGLYMILRPYLHIASQQMEFPPRPAGTSVSSKTSSPAYSGDSTSTTSSRHMPMVELSADQQTIISVACQCINSAIQSTIAFDRVGAPPDSPYHGFRSTRTRRLVVTNVVGTLHAQFGNMLILVAVFLSKLFNYLPADTQLTKTNLTALLRRTIDTLSEVAPNSPVLDMDIQILNSVGRQYGLL